MNKRIACLFGLALGTLSLSAAPFYVESFNYPNGPLVGNDSWILTGTATANPEQVLGGKVQLASSGQDVNASFAPVTLNDGDTLFMGVTINVAAAQGAGDYFLHVTPGPAGNSFDFFQRIFIRSIGGGFPLGYAETSSGATATYGNDVLSYGADYRVILAYNRVPGLSNDTGTLYVNPPDLNNPALDPIYVTKTWSSSAAETNIVATINLRQGSGSAAPNLTVDDLALGLAFSDVSAIPEPQNLLWVVGFGLLAWNFVRRRR
jgi:hypothetical protein